MDKYFEFQNKYKLGSSIEGEIINLEEIGYEEKYLNGSIILNCDPNIKGYLPYNFLFDDIGGFKESEIPEIGTRMDLIVVDWREDGLTLSNKTNDRTIEATRFKEYYKLIKNELSHRNQFGYKDVIRFTLKSFLITLERIHRTDHSAPLELNNAYELQFFKFKELIEAHYKEGLSVKDYASLLNISSKTLTTISKTVVNKSPSIIIAERIILQAKRLLKFTTLQIGEIAFKIGFDDASYFVKFFKRHVGVSPSNYRA